QELVEKKLFNKGGKFDCSEEALDNLKKEADKQGLLYKNLRLRRLYNDLKLLRNAVDDEKIYDKFAEAIYHFLKRKEIENWSSYEVLEVDRNNSYCR
ncbi:MAG: hypothetical protein DRP81_07920, partial [Candidatus Omnitrophota bacterium]